MMRDLLGAEWLKTRTTRSNWVLAVTAVVVGVGAAAITAAATAFTPSAHPARQVLATAGLSETVALLLGVLAVTTEIRHGTITPVVLITPRRVQIFAAKLVSASVTGAALGLLSFGAAASVVLPVLAARHVPSQLGTAGLAGIIGGAAASAGLFAALGVGLGALVRNQVGAVVGALSLVYAVFPLLGTLPRVGSTAQHFGFDGLSSAATGTTDFLARTRLPSAGVALGVLASYAFVVAVCGLAVFRRSDVG